MHLMSESFIVYVLDNPFIFIELIVSFNSVNVFPNNPIDLVAPVASSVIV